MGFQRDTVQRRVSLTRIIAHFDLEEQMSSGLVVPTALAARHYTEFPHGMPCGYTPGGRPTLVDTLPCARPGQHLLLLPSLEEEGSSGLVTVNSRSPRFPPSARVSQKGRVVSRYRGIPLRWLPASGLRAWRAGSLGALLHGLQNQRLARRAPEALVVVEVVLAVAFEKDLARPGGGELD